MASSDDTMNFDQADPVPLDPIILLARDELLEKYSDKSFEEQITLKIHQIYYEITKLIRECMSKALTF